MIKKIMNYIEYKKRLRLLKMIAVNKLTDFVINNDSYIVGFNKLLLSMANSDNAEELQKILNDYVAALNATIKVNKSLNKDEK
jgi:hypothetical protein